MQGSTQPSVRTRREVQGRPASIDAAQVRAIKAQGIGASEIAKCRSMDGAALKAKPADPY
jgi:hypothetical protein